MAGDSSRKVTSEIERELLSSKLALQVTELNPTEELWKVKQNSSLRVNPAEEQVEEFIYTLYTPKSCWAAPRKH